MKTCSETQILLSYLKIRPYYTPLADPDLEPVNRRWLSEYSNGLTAVAAVGDQRRFVLSGSHNCVVAYGDAHQRLSSYRIFDTISRYARLRGQRWAVPGFSCLECTWRAYQK